MYTYMSEWKINDNLVKKENDNINVNENINVILDGNENIIDDFPGGCKWRGGDDHPGNHAGGPKISLNISPFISCFKNLLVFTLS